jgi:quinoprotein glucose dehydrogenase
MLCAMLAIALARGASGYQGPAPAAAPQTSSEHKSWHQYGGGPDQSKYVEFKEITKSNVRQLDVAWTYPCGEGAVFNPIIVDGVMYLLADNSTLVALDATNGKVIWRRSDLSGIIRFGINYWESKDKKVKRLITCIRDTLQAIDATTGESITNFGVNGSTPLKEGLGWDPATVGRVQGTAPGQIFDNLILLGSSPGESYFSAPGHLRAYDVVTGKLVWVFHTIPWPGEPGYDTWPKNAYKYAGGVNTWGEITIDEKNGIAYFPLGAPTYDYFGADRIGNDLYDECILALDVRTGKHLWHFQTVHHGLWDYDLCSAPQLITVQHDGKRVEAVAVAGKQGFLFVFNRFTGEPLWPIEERQVPPSDVPQEHASPTQPFPTVVPPFTRQNVATNDFNPYFSPLERAAWTRRLAAAKTGLYQPLSDKYETIAMPGAVGGANRGNTGADPAKGIVYVMSQDYASVYKLNRENPIPSAAPGTQHQDSPARLADQSDRSRDTYAQICLTCHATGKIGTVTLPSLVKVTERVTFDQFSLLLTTGRGQMPGFPHIDESTKAGLYRLLGGDPDAGTGRPVANAARNSQRRRERQRGLGPNGSYGYPEGVVGPTNDFSTGYGMEFPNLLSPPWSSITAYDLNQGTIKWRRSLGQDPKIAALGGKDTGIPVGSQRKGMVVTATGLIFATCLDGNVYAYDADDGRLLWNHQMARNTEGIPAMYEVNGREFLVVCDAGNLLDRSSPSAPPPQFIVYALPKRQ